MYFGGVSIDWLYDCICFRKNINCSISESLNRFEEVMQAANEVQIPVRG